MILGAKPLKRLNSAFVEEDLNRFRTVFKMFQFVQDIDKPWSSLVKKIFIL